MDASAFRGGRVTPRGMAAPPHAQQRGYASVAPPLRALPPRASPIALHVFDFDSTLIDTPLPEAGAAAWLAATGTPWPHAGWWGRPESLSPLLPSRPGPAMAAYRAAAASDLAVVVLLTGRRAALAAQVRACLVAHGVDALHAERYNDTRLDTLGFKSRALRDFVGQYAASLRDVHIYEDRAPHAEYFQQLGAAEFPHLTWHVHLVVPEPIGDTATPSVAPAAIAPARPGLPRPRTLAPPPQQQQQQPPPPPPPQYPPEQRKPLPFVDVSHYARLCVPMPRAAAAVPPAWRANKEARDGAWPPAHITLMTSAELRDTLAAAAAAPASAPFLRRGAAADAAAAAATPEVAPAAVEPVSPADMRRALVAAARRVRTAPLHFKGLGVAVGASGAACAFMVVDWPAGAAFRRRLGLPKQDFHTTLGFEPEDPHDVRKNASALLRQPPGGWPPGEAGVQAQQAAVLARAEQLREKLQRGHAGGSRAEAAREAA